MGNRSVLSGLDQATETLDQGWAKGSGSQVRGCWTLARDCAAVNVVFPFPTPELPEPA